MNNELQHWGIKGMRWGIRRKRDSKTGRVESQDSKTAKAIGKKKLSEMSNEDLKKLTTRLQLEKQYKDLTKKETSAGKQFVKELLVNEGKRQAQQVLTTQSKKAAKQVAKMIEIYKLTRDPNKGSSSGFDPFSSTSSYNFKPKP